MPQYYQNSAPSVPARPGTALTSAERVAPPKPARSQAAEKYNENAASITNSSQPKPPTGNAAPPIPPRPTDKKLASKTSLQTLFSAATSAYPLIMPTRPVSDIIPEGRINDVEDLKPSRNSATFLYKLFAPSKHAAYSRPVTPPLNLNTSTPQTSTSKASTAVSSPKIPSSAPLPRKKPPKYQVPPEFTARYALRDELGIGGYGYIFSAIRRKDSREVAVKLMPREHVAANRWTVDPGLGLVPMELWVMKNVSHPGIVQFYDLYQTDEILLIVMELFGNSWKNLPYEKSTAAIPQPADKFLTTGAKGVAPPANDDAIPIIGAMPLRRRSTDLFELLEVNALTEVESHMIFVQVVDTLDHLLTYHGLIHGDIKDENVLIARAPDGEMKVKMIDFGATTRVRAGKYLHNHRTQDKEADLLNPAADCSCGKRLSGQNFCGTLEFAPPEVLKGEPFYDGERAQIWSIGVLLYDMLFRCMPFADVQAAIHQPFAKNPTVVVSDLCLDLLDKLLQKDPAKRPTLEEITQHPWIKNGPPKAK